MKFKVCVFVSWFVLAVSVRADVTITNVVARQDWPWSTDVYVEYALSGASAEAPVDISVAATLNGQAITVPDAAVSGVRLSLWKDDCYHLVLNPAKIPAISSKTTAGNFRISLSATAAGFANSEVLYRIYDLVKTNLTEVTRADLLNGIYGSYALSNDLTWIPDTMLEKTNNPIVWTGVTNDAYYATNAIVLRKIHPGTFKTGSLTVHLTYDYWIGVFDITQAQWAKVMNGSGKVSPSYFSVDGACRPVESVNYFCLRESSSSSCSIDAAYGWPTNSTPSNPIVSDWSFVGRLRKMFPGTLFDLPTDAQWEFASLAGDVESTIYNPLIWSRCKENGGYIYTNGVYGNPPRTVGPTNGTANVGSYLANAFGLYDMIGNVQDWCLDLSKTDWYASSAVVTNPPGPVTSDRTYVSRVSRGGGWDASSTSPLFKNSVRGWPNASWPGGGNGFHIAIPHKGSN